MSDILLDEQAAREYTDARSSAGGKASSLKQGSTLLEANGYTEQDYTDDDARAAWGRSSGQIGGRIGGKATILSHGDQLGNGQKIHNQIHSHFKLLLLLYTQTNSTHHQNLLFYLITPHHPHLITNSTTSNFQSHRPLLLILSIYRERGQGQALPFLR
jgi:hypothetical protein